MKWPLRLNHAAQGCTRASARADACAPLIFHQNSNGQEVPTRPSPPTVRCNRGPAFLVAASPPRLGATGAAGCVRASGMNGVFDLHARRPRRHSGTTHLPLFQQQPLVPQASMGPPNGRRTLSASSREPLQCVNVGFVRRGLGQRTVWVAVGRTYRSQRRFAARLLHGSGLCMTQGPPSPAPPPASLSVIQACPTVCQHAGVAAATRRRMGACDAMGLWTTAVHALSRGGRACCDTWSSTVAARPPSPPPAPARLWRTCPARLLGCRRWACVGMSWRGVGPSRPCPRFTVADRRVRDSAR